MIRISRLVSSNRISDILNLEGVCKIELRQGKQKNLRKPISRVLIYLCMNTMVFRGYMGNMRKFALKTDDNRLRTTVDTAVRDGFIKESAFHKLYYPMPKEYRKYCDLYSQEFFNSFGNERRIMEG